MGRAEDIEAIAAFLDRIQGHAQKGEDAAVGTTARSLITRCLSLVEISAVKWHQSEARPGGPQDAIDSAYMHLQYGGTDGLNNARAVLAKHIVTHPECDQCGGRGWSDYVAHIACDCPAGADKVTQ